MLAVAIPEKDAHGIESEEISLASVNAPDQCVLSGPVEAIEGLQGRSSGGRRPFPPSANIARVSFRHDGAHCGGLSRNHAAGFTCRRRRFGTSPM